MMRLPKSPASRTTRRPAIIGAALGAIVWVIVPLAALVLFPAQAVAQRETSTLPDPSDVYLQAFLYLQESEKLEAQGDRGGAYVKAKEASDLVDSVARSYPTWNPQMVDFRRKKIRKKLVELRPKSTLPPSTRNTERSRSVVPRIPGTTANAPISQQVKERFSRYEAEIRRLADERTQLLANLESKENILRETRKQLFLAQKTEKDLRTKLINAEEEIGARKTDEEIAVLKSQVADLKSDLAKAADAMAAANTRTGALLDELEKANSTIKELRTSQEGLRKERDELAAILDKTDDDPLSKDQLKVTNYRLRAELEKAKTTITNLQEVQVADRDTIDGLREQLGGVKKELENIRKENTAYKSTIADLNSKLERTSERLAASPTMSVPEAVTENSVLRKIILQQLRTQSRREQSKQLVLDKLTALEADSEDMIAAVEAVAGPTIELSAGEQSLFQDPQFDQFTSNSTIQTTLIARANPNAIVKAPLTPEKRTGLAQELLAKAGAAAEAFRQGDYKNSDEVWGEILEAEPQNVFAMEERSVVKLRRRRLSEAETLLKKALAYNFENPQSHYLLGITYYKQGKTTTAADAFEQALALESPTESSQRTARAHNYLGLINIRRERTSAARSEFQLAVNEDPSFADAHFNLAVLYATADDPDMNAAKRHYRKARNNGSQRNSTLEKFLDF
ncbi:tetratricopeptide repeat protein [Verrucomicrobiales bacterium]|nr:tetratricopeptide repeat protein [Verrucomicrobiales bacterium]